MCNLYQLALTGQALAVAGNELHRRKFRLLGLWVVDHFDLFIEGIGLPVIIEGVAGDCLGFHGVESGACGPLL